MINDNVNDNDIMNSQVNMTDIHHEERENMLLSDSADGDTKVNSPQRTPNMLDDRHNDHAINDTRIEFETTFNTHIRYRLSII